MICIILLSKQRRKGVVNIKNDDNDYNNFNDIITPNHYVRIKPRETILKKKEKYAQIE